MSEKNWLSHMLLKGGQKIVLNVAPIGAHLLSLSSSSYSISKLAVIRLTDFFPTEYSAQGIICRIGSTSQWRQDRAVFKYTWSYPLLFGWSWHGRITGRYDNVVDQRRKKSGSVADITCPSLRPALAIICCASEGPPGYDRKKLNSQTWMERSSAIRESLFVALP